MIQLNKWQKELQALQKVNYRKTDNQLFNVYRQSLIDIKKRLKVYTENAESLSFSTRLEVERLFSVADEINAILQLNSPKVEKTIKGYSAKQAEQGYYGLWYTLEQSQNIALNMPLINHDYIMNLVNAPVAGKRLSKRLYKYRDELAQNVTNNIITGLFEGKSYAEIARWINEETEASYKQALRIARTEAGRTQSVTTQKGYEEAKERGINIKKKWLATIDKHTRRTHQELDGKEVDVDEDFTIRGHSAKGPRMFGVASEDVNCRCTTIEVVDGISPELRKDNESKEMSEFKSYDDWFKGRIRGEITDDLADKAMSLKKFIEGVDLGDWDHLSEAEMEALEAEYEEKSMQLEKILAENPDILRLKEVPKDLKTALAENLFEIKEIDELFYNTENYLNWRQIITDEQYEAIFNYAASSDYMNYYLRHPENIEKLITGSGLDKLKLQVMDLQEILGRYTAQTDFTVYRGSDVVYNLDELVPGTERVFDKAFLSSSLDRAAAQSFAKNASSPVFYEIDVKKGSKVGAYIEEISKYGEKEKEFLFNASTKFKIISVNKTDEALYLKLEAIE
ncbi:head protein [Enterococcus faecalis]